MRKEKAAYTHAIPSYGNVPVDTDVPVDTWNLDCIKIIPQENELGPPQHWEDRDEEESSGCHKAHLVVVSYYLPLFLFLPLSPPPSYFILSLSLMFS